MASSDKKRRRGPDLLVKSIQYFVTLSWILLLMLFIVFSVAKPRMETFFDRWDGGSLSGTWDKTFIGYAFYLMVVLFIVSLIGLLINGSRHKRKSDSYNLSLVIFLIMSLVGIIVFLLS